MNKLKKNQTGVILLLTMFILTGILVVTLGAADIIFSGIKMNRLTGYSSVALCSAEAGLERALWEARKNGYVPPDSDQSNIFSNILSNGSSYQINNIFDPLNPNKVIFKSIGSYSGVKRSVESTYEE